MEALSPRDANQHLRKQPVTKPKAAAAKPMSKEKDHPPPPPPAVIEPVSLDRKDGAVYRTGKLLGKGGFAICYEARLAGTKQLYALKVVKSHMPQKKMEQKFQTELQIHSKMKHPNVVRFHRAFSFNQCTFLVLELCPNGSLMDMVKKRRFITEPEVRYWTVQMAGAIKYMHDKGIIHRDLKMGNIFLDKDMNVKIGDFGLAALLMSGKDWTNVRRTTLCGTPNYIAPEILSKDKQGHDHAVDIWSLGIIIFAMLTGKPPFQSTTAEEIYRRAREREYDWPELNKSDNFISAETKDLVSLMLQPAEERPDPDTIVQHPFFTCGWMPQSGEILPEFREAAPTSDQFLSVGVRGGRTALYLRNLKKLCAVCGVGPWGSKQKPQQSTYREVAAEEKAGLTPAIPLPEGIVYRPFNEWLREQADHLKGSENVKTTTEEADQAVDMILDAPPKRMEPPMPSTRPVAQSFAAQQRARPGMSQQPSRVPRTLQPSSETLTKLPSSSSRPILNISARLTRPRKGELKYTEDVAEVQDRLAIDVVEQLPLSIPERKKIKVAQTPVPQEKYQSLFSAREKLDRLPNTKPDDVLKGLHRLQSELERALNSRTTAIESKSLHPALNLVVKWVDYTNKHGLGYILSNGSIGCIFSTTPLDASDESKGSLPPCSVIVRDAEHHLQNRDNKSYPDRHEVVPIHGPDIEFFESQGESGIVCGRTSPINFKLAPGKTGQFGKLESGVNEWEHRKRGKLVLWKKFANYMVSYGKDHIYPDTDVQKRETQEKKADSKPSSNVISFYQRWGDVGCWGFGDGHFQFNFPDHTKIVITADGTWCDFYHLPMEAAREIATKGTLSPSALDDRQNLSFPTQTLLNFMTKPAKSTTRKRPEIDPMIQGIPQANEFRKKIEFIRDVVREWVSNGGLGNSNMDTEHRLRWTGHREIVNTKKEYKHVWVTVGARNGDDRRVALFDPRKPEEVRLDMDPQKA